MIRVLTSEEINDLLATQLFARLGCHGLGKTYVVPISFAIDGNRLIGQTTPGMKTQIMRENPEVCVEVDDIKSLAEWRSAILWGRYEELHGVERSTAMGLLIDRYGPEFEGMGLANRGAREVTPPRLDAAPSPLVVYCIHLSERTGRCESPVS